MRHLTALRRRLLILSSATLLALAVWTLDYVLLPPLWPTLISSSTFNFRPIAAAAHVNNYERIYHHWFGNQEIQQTELRPRAGADSIAPMSKIPAGYFQRGYRWGSPDEQFEQTIYVDEFYLDRYEVTQQDYQLCIGHGACRAVRPSGYMGATNQQPATVDQQLPVTWVTWRDAADYCQFVHKRLPTEAEWEKAARGPGHFLYPWGENEPTTQANFGLLGGRVMKGGAYPGDQSRYGVFDMAGNVREWVADWYQWDYYTTASIQNPHGPLYGDTKVVRGGNWSSNAGQLRASRRGNVLPTTAEANLGFRCASSTFPPLQP